MATGYVFLLGLLLYLKDFNYAAVATTEPGISYIADKQGHNTTITNSGNPQTLEPTAQPEGNQTNTPKPEPGTDYNDTVTSEPDDGESEPEKDKPEPENEPEPEAEEGFAEPGPEWEDAKMEWQAAWELHVYIFGSLFTILGLYCLIGVIRLWKMNHLLSKHYFLSLNVLNMSVCLLRAIYLFIDAYNSRGTFPAILDYFLYSTVFPCLTALFSVLFYALLLATRLRIMSQKVQRLHVLIAIIAFHFLLSFVADIAVGLSTRTAVLIFICQVFYVIWGLLMFIGFLIIFRRMYSGVLKRQSIAVKDLKNTYLSASGRRDKVPKQKNTLGLAVRITLASALFGVACIGFQLFGMFGVYGVIGDYGTPKPWAWWIYHTGMRLLEILMCSSIAVVSLQPLKLTYKDQKHQTLICLFPCCLSCYEDKSDEEDGRNSFTMDSSVITETNVLKTKDAG